MVTVEKVFHFIKRGEKKKVLNSTATSELWLHIDKITWRKCSYIMHKYFVLKC
jgi:hypothetical protein